MTDRHCAYIVTLAEDLREDDAEPVLRALQMVKGVLSVRPLETDYTTHVARQRRDTAWRAALQRLLRDGVDE